MTKEDIEIMKRYDDYSVEELKAALQRYFLCSDLTDEDVDEMERILAAIRKKAPFPHPHTTEEMWAEFKADHAEELAALGIRNDTETEEVVEKKPQDQRNVEPADGKTDDAKPAVNLPQRHRGVLRVGLIAAIVAVLVVAFTVTALACSFFGWIPKWNDEVLSFESETTEKPYMESVPDLLKRLGITEPLYPTWLPEDFVKIKSKIVEKPLFLSEKFQGDDRSLSITIYPNTASGTTDYQKEGASPVEYTVGNAAHYIFENTNEVSAVWNTEEYTTLIVGNISTDEMQKIIDSVYEVKE